VLDRCDSDNQLRHQTTHLITGDGNRSGNEQSVSSQSLAFKDSGSRELGCMNRHLQTRISTLFSFVHTDHPGLQVKFDSDVMLTRTGFTSASVWWTTNILIWYPLKLIWIGSEHYVLFRHLHSWI